MFLRDFATFSKVSLIILGCLPVIAGLSRLKLEGIESLYISLRTISFTLILDKNSHI